MPRALSLVEPWLVPVQIAVSALVVVPSLASPFHTPKLAVLLVGAVCSCALALARGRHASPGLASGVAPAPIAIAAPLAFLLALGLSGTLAPLTSIDALLRDASAGVLVLTLVHTGVNLRAVGLTTALAGTTIAVVALLQALGVDPFAALGFSPALAGTRLRVYATLGNPDFVASWLSAAVCVGAGEAMASRSRRTRALLGGGLVLQFAALASTRSLATAPALVGAAILALVAAPAAARSRCLRLSIAALIAAAALASALAAGGRDPGRAIAGRAYLVRTCLARVFEAPLLGHGPGSFVALHPGWEAEYWAVGAPDPSERRFVSAQDHAHNDYLERALDTGLLGLAAFALLLGAALAVGVRALRRGIEDWPRVTGAAAGLAALAARGLVDFPFARPADLLLTAVLVAGCLRAASTIQATVAET